MFQVCLFVYCLLLRIAAGLYYLAELVKEFTVMTAKVIRYATCATIAVYAGLALFEDLPLSMLAFGALAQFFHLALLQSFPFFEIWSAQFIISIGNLSNSN